MVKAPLPFLLQELDISLNLEKAFYMLIKCIFISYSYIFYIPYIISILYISLYSTYIPTTVQSGESPNRRTRTRDHDISPFYQIID